MKQAQEIADYLHGLGKEQDADYVIFMAESIQNDELHMTRLMKERDELAAQVERLREFLEDMHVADVDWTIQRSTELHKETPPQSLAAVRAEAVESARDSTKDSMTHGGVRWICHVDHLTEYAQGIRNGEA